MLPVQCFLKYSSTAPDKIYELYSYTSSLKSERKIHPVLTLIKELRRFIESDVTKALYLEPTCINVLLVNPCVCRVSKFVSVYGIDSTARVISNFQLLERKHSTQIIGLQLFHYEDF